jgi:hypothetical protein
MNQDQIILSHCNKTKSKPLIVDFYPQAPNGKHPTLIRAKLPPSGSRYLELDLFKQQIQGDVDGTPQYTYATSQEKVRWYRTVFFAMGFVFLVLAALAFRQNILIFSAYFGNIGQLAKGFLGGISLSLACLAGVLGYGLCVAKEASHHVASRAKRKLLQLYSRKRLERGLQGLQGLFFLRENLGKHAALKHEYRHTLELIEEQQEKTTHLLQKIQNYSVVDAGYRELLFNQALAELNDQLQSNLQSFKVA